MTALVADIRIAVELVDRAEVDSWPRLTEDLMHSPPRIHEGNAERMETLVAWLAPYAELQPSLVQAAVANFARVLADLLLVLHYDLNVDSAVYQVPKWYRLEPGSRALEEWGIHVCLLQNLTIELTRAINLVIARVQQAESTVLAHQAFAVCDSGPPHAPLEAVTYTVSQAEEIQPYPGLAGFPAVLAGRTVGGLGFHEGEVPRTADEFDRWIVSLAERRGACSKPPPSGSPPFALPKPEQHNAAAPIPGAWTIASTVFTIAAATVGVFTYSWLAGAAIALSLVTFALRRHLWRRPPNYLALLVVLLAAVSGGVLAEVAAHIVRGDNKQTAPRTHTEGAGTPTSQRSSADGQVEAGNFFRGGTGPVDAFTDPLLVPVGRRFRLGVRLSDAGPDEIPRAVVRVSLPDVAAASASVTAAVKAAAAYPNEVADTATVNFRSDASGCLRYALGSTQLLDSHHGVIRALPDGVVQGGVAVGTLGVALTDVRYVVFTLHSTAAAVGSHCS